MKRVMSLVLAGLVGLMASVGVVAESASYSKQKVVYHINGDDPQQQKGALRNIQNHINAVGVENLDLRVVMHGNGLSMVLLPDAVSKVKKFKSGNATEEMQAKIDGLRNQGVKFEVCANTIKGRGVIVDEHLYNVDKADIVPSGVAELANLQGQGFTYIKP